MTHRLALYVKLGARRTAIATVVVATLLSSSFLPGAGAAVGAPGAVQVLQTVTRTGTGTFGAGPAGLAGDTLNQTLPGDLGNDNNPHTGTVNLQIPAAKPHPVAKAVVADNPSRSGFPGLDHFDTRTRDGGNAFSLEPPDQGLCVGNGFTLEAVNDVMVVFDGAGNRLTTPTSMNTFFNLPYAINRSTGVRGNFLSDPKCLYDAATNRFFLTMLEEDPAPSVRSHTLIAVSQSGDPRAAWSEYAIDATDDGQNGTPSNPLCPCFGDQPLIGADAYGFYITTNEFGGGFNGAQIYAMSKSALAAGSLPVVVHINAGTVPTPDPGGIWYSIQPATSPNASDFDTAHNGTEHFLSALQFGPAPLDNRIAAWALTNTSSLNSVAPSVTLLKTVIGSETYGTPPNGIFAAQQKAGSTPLADALGGMPENALNANDDRMNQVVLAGGRLYSGLNTMIGDGTQTAIAYFVVSPNVSTDGTTESATIATQGYVSSGADNVLFPSFAVNSSGKGIIAFTLSGPDYYPSAAYIRVTPAGAVGPIRILGAGVGPADGFTGYAPYGGNGVERWGDYSAAVAASDGSIWFATEFIGQTCSDAQFKADSTCGGTRTLLANWSTFVGHVHV